MPLKFAVSLIVGIVESGGIPARYWQKLFP